MNRTPRESPLEPDSQTEETGISRRDRLILAGLYLSKYDSLGLQMLGFDSFTEAYNVIGYSLMSRPLSIKNYRDEFDPLFPNARMGRRNRATREYCLRVFNQFKGLDLQSFTGLVKSFLTAGSPIAESNPLAEELDEGTSSFALRLITGLAAERYFEQMHADLPEFKGYQLENTTKYGCGYDFRLRAGVGDKDFLAVEVKGLRQKSGRVAMTAKEHDVAFSLKDRFILFVVRNFRETPSHRVLRNPLSGQLHFEKVEQVIVQVSWLTSI